MNNENDYIIQNDDLISISLDQDGVRLEATRAIPVNCRNGYKLFENVIDGTVPKRYIINENATILFWVDGTKTVIKRKPEDEYNKKLAFLIAYFQKRSGFSKTQANKYLDSLIDENEI